MPDMKNSYTLIASLLFASAAVAAPVSVELGQVVDGKKVPEALWGIFFEDINWAADGGLSVELLANGGFDWRQPDHEKWTRAVDGWEPEYRIGGMARLSFQYGNPVHPNTAKHLRIESFGSGLAGVRNTGLDGMRLRKGEPYRLQFDVRRIVRKGLDFELGAWSREVHEFTCEEGHVFTAIGQNYVVEVAGDSLCLLANGGATVEFDNVSLRPTGPNLVRAGMRKDLVDRLADLKPSFVRFPGGCIVEEGDFQHWYDWRRTVGPKERRECIWNRWGRPDKPYWETFDIGYYEYFILCEELGAECEIHQSNHEGVLVDLIQGAYGRMDAIVINPAAYTHTSVAILDALKAVSLPAVEVHLSDVNAREEFRRLSYAGMACEKTFAGYGFEGYRMAVEYLVTKYGV